MSSAGQTSGTWADALASRPPLWLLPWVLSLVACGGDTGHDPQGADRAAEKPFDRTSVASSRPRWQGCLCSDAHWVVEDARAHAALRIATP